ncbi:MAG TPA: Lsr2 family protein [Kineosporiaceae bacterium]|nr:Lsr2 family protein [Kineosporiaceae bacterium]
MAQKVLTTLQDDIDGSKASETVTFALDGVTYQIDLNTRHATKLRKTFAPFISAGRRVGGRSVRRAPAAVAPAPAARRSRAKAETPVDPAAVRAWASANRIKVSPRGRIPGSVVAQFRAAGH